ncbi:MAG: polyprenyl synthetase family protein [Chloroflexota bacterium]
MNNFDNYYLAVTNKITNTQFLREWTDCHAVLLQNSKDSSLRQQMDLVFNASIAAGGSARDVIPVAAAWLAVNEATHLIDQVQDNFTPFRTETENLSFALIFAAYHFLSGIQSNFASEVFQVFSQCGFRAFLGQNKGFEPTESMPLPAAIELYWNSTILKSGGLFRMFIAGSAAAVTNEQKVITALGDYGMALGTIFQILDDCRDVLDGQGNYEKSLPILLYSSAIRSETIVLPEAKSRGALLKTLDETGTLQVISNILLNWQERGLTSLNVLNPSVAVGDLKYILMDALRMNALSTDIMQV